MHVSHIMGGDIKEGLSTLWRKMHQSFPNIAFPVKKIFPPKLRTGKHSNRFEKGVRCSRQNIGKKGGMAAGGIPCHSDGSHY